MHVNPLLGATPKWLEIIITYIYPFLLGVCIYYMYTICRYITYSKHIILLFPAAKKWRERWSCTPYYPIPPLLLNSGSYSKNSNILIPNTKDQVTRRARESYFHFYFYLNVRKIFQLKTHPHGQPLPFQPKSAQVTQRARWLTASAGWRHTPPWLPAAPPPLGTATGPPGRCPRPTWRKWRRSRLGRLRSCPWHRQNGGDGSVCDGTWEKTGKFWEKTGKFWGKRKGLEVLRWWKFYVRNVKMPGHIPPGGSFHLANLKLEGPCPSLVGDPITIITGIKLWLLAIGY